MKFPYHKFSLPQRSDFFGETILKPVIPVKISNGLQDINYTALIDSGADFCIFDAEIGENIGLDIKSGSPIEFGGIQEIGGTMAYLHELELTIGGWNYKTTVGFSYDIAKQSFGVLGQKGFFDIFTVKFDLIKEEIELKGRR